MYQMVVMVGRLTADPELKTTPNGVSVTQFSIAVDRSYADKDGKRQADFFEVVAWRKLAEFIVKHFHKGKPILLDGHLERRSYGAKDGSKRYVIELIAENAKFVGDSSGKSGTASIPEPPPERYSGQASASGDFHDMPESGDDLPF